MWSRTMFYQSVVHEILIYGNESWVITDSTIKVLGGFHHRIAQRIVGKTAHHGRGMRVAPRVGGPRGGRTVVHAKVCKQRQATIEDYISTRPIYELCARVDHLQGTIRIMRWWVRHHIRAEGDNRLSGD